MCAGSREFVSNRLHPFLKIVPTVLYGGCPAVGGGLAPFYASVAPGLVVILGSSFLSFLFINI